jgi:arylsulfatase
MPTLLAAAGDPDVTQKLLKGYKVGEKSFKNHLDGYNFLPFFKGQEATAPRRQVFYFDDNANLNAIRVNDWKITFKFIEGNLASGTLKQPNMPVVVNLRQDPFERYYGESQMYFRWAADKLAAFVPAQVIVGQFLQTFKEYPPSQKSGGFGVDQALQALQAGAAGTNK